MRKYLEANYHCKIWQDGRGYHIEFDGVEVKICKYMSEVEDYLKERKAKSVATKQSALIVVSDL